LKFRAVHADSGAIGGEGGSHEFMALADIGEDTIAACTVCDYAANLEQAESVRPVKNEVVIQVPEIEKFLTPDLRTIEQLEQELDIRPDQIIKTLIYEGDGQIFAVLVRGDHEVNEIKVSKYLGTNEIKLADYESVKSLAGVESGFVGPVGLTLTVLADAAVADMTQGITGAGEKDYHFRNVVPGRDFSPWHVGDFRNVAEGEVCPHCLEGILYFHQGIEVGHVFKLGTKYSEKLGASYLDSSGKSQPMIMGCYGIGISRLLSAIAEQHHDEDGLMWPAALAPYQVHILIMSVKDSEQRTVAEGLYDQLTKLGIETLIDDRDERAGVKFKDSSLIGIPLSIVVGKEASQGRVEYLNRNTAGKEVLEIMEAVSRIKQFYSPLI